MVNTASISSLRRWKKRFARASVILALLMGSIAYLAGYRIDDIPQNLDHIVLAITATVTVVVFFMIVTSSNQYHHDSKLSPWMAKWDRSPVWTKISNRYELIVWNLILFQLSYTNIKLIAAYLLKIDPPSLETKGFLALLAAYSISLTGLSATSLWIWYIHRRSTFAKIQREEGPEEEEKPNEQGKQEKTKPGAFGEERQAISTFFKTTIAVIIFMFIYLILGADIDKLEVITFWPIALEPSTDWL